MDKPSSKKIALTSITLAIALIIGTIESLMPPVIPVMPFVRLGLSNIVLIFALVTLGASPAFIIAILKSVLVPLFVGNPIMIAYSLPSAAASLAATALLANTQKIGLPTISVVAALVHNIVQLCVAAVMIGTTLVFGYAPYLIFVGSIAGLGVGIASWLLIRYFPARLFYH